MRLDYPALTRPYQLVKTMKTSHWVVGLLVSALDVPAFAQDRVPALAAPAATPTHQAAMQEHLPPVSMVLPLPPVSMISLTRVQLDAKEATGVQLSNEWKNHPDKPGRGADGSVKYLFGATLPTLVCMPLKVCSIRLQPGEVINDVHTGDTVRWKITPATQGSGTATTALIIIKPTDAGLTTNLVVTTDRRVYTIKLASTQSEWIPMLAFDYPDDIEREWTAWKLAQDKRITANTMPGEGGLPSQNIANLDFNFKLSGDNPSWKPVRVYSDGSKTYIQFESTSFGGEAPALVALANDGGLFSSATEQLVNYRVIGDRYVVDKVLQRAALIVGVGSGQTKVVITRTGKR